MKTIDDLIKLKPCEEGLHYVTHFATLQEAWDSCNNSKWMWWYLRKNRVSKEISISFMTTCFNHVKHLCSPTSFTIISSIIARAEKGNNADAAVDACIVSIDVAKEFADVNAVAAAKKVGHNLAVVYATFFSTVFDDELKWQADQLRILVPILH